MKIMSEKTGKEYATVEECLAAEKEFDDTIAKEQEEKEKLAAIRKERAAEVEEAYKKILEANKNYNELLNAFIKDYGSFHMTLHTGDYNPFNAFHRVFENFWN